MQWFQSRRLGKLFESLYQLPKLWEKFKWNFVLRVVLKTYLEGRMAFHCSRGMCLLRSQCCRFRGQCLYHIYWTQVRTLRSLLGVLSVELSLFLRYILGNVLIIYLSVVILFVRSDALRIVSSSALEAPTGSILYGISKH